MIHVRILTMKIEIEKIAQTENQEHYRIVTPVEVKKEEELRYQKEIIELLKEDSYQFEKGNNPAFPNTWFLHISRGKN